MAKTKTKNKASSGDVVTVDFEGTESRGGKKSGGGRKHYPEGDYKVKVKDAKWGRSANKESPRLEVTYNFTEGKLKGKEIRDDLYLSPKALWRLRNAMEAMGIQVPDKKVKVNPDKLVGKTCAVTLEDEEYEEKIYSRVTDTYSLDEWDDSASDLDDDDEDDDDEDDSDDDEDDDEDEDSDDEDDDDLDDLDDL